MTVGCAGWQSDYFLALPVSSVLFQTFEKTIKQKSYCVNGNENQKLKISETEFSFHRNCFLLSIKNRVAFGGAVPFTCRVGRASQ